MAADFDADHTQCDDINVDIIDMEEEAEEQQVEVEQEQEEGPMDPGKVLGVGGVGGAGGSGGVSNWMEWRSEKVAENIQVASQVSFVLQNWSLVGF